MVVAAASESRAGGRRGPGSTVFTDERARLEAPRAEPVQVDPALRAATRRIAARLALPRARRHADAHRGLGEIESVPYQAGLDEIDLDRTIEVLAERRVLGEHDVIVRDRVRSPRSVVLAIDVSGSMRGERIRTAAAALGALGGELSRDHLAVLAFWSDAAWLSHLGVHTPAEKLVEALVQIPARGLTNVAFPLDVAARELARARSNDARVLLLSDCVHNAGPDPRPLAARLPRLDVLLDATGERDGELARELVRLGRGRLRLLRTHRDVAPALNAIFAP